MKICMLHRKLKLNDGKTEVVIVKGGLGSNLEAEFGSLDIGGIQLHPVSYTHLTLPTKA